MFLRLSTTDARPSSSSSPPLPMTGFSKLFLKIRRLAYTQPQGDSSPPCHPLTPIQAVRSPLSTPTRARHSSEDTTYLSPPSSPVASRISPSSSTSSRSSRQKSHHIKSSSGENPVSHPFIAEHACERREFIERTDTYHCTGGVNVPALLRTTRTDLIDIASVLGANALVDEQWHCTICGPSRNKLTYKVRIHYKARATRSTHPDPHRPVALDQTQSIPGLMTVIRLNDD
ncbi:hypothetical protein APHAL10511_006804 [Amanita phalloides]|nr:hypothetical protein APHAL10511_006804 [Amanita phalloides]